jgi:hypothetical protein
MAGSVPLAKWCQPPHTSGRGKLFTPAIACFPKDAKRRYPPLQRGDFTAVHYLFRIERYTVLKPASPHQRVRSTLTDYPLLCRVPYTHSYLLSSPLVAPDARGLRKVHVKAEIIYM